MELSPQFMAQILQIIWIDLLLSGDNAVVIALACRSLPPEQRKWGILLGAGAAIGLRIVFALIITFLLAIPLLKLIGGVLLFWIAIKLLKGEEAAHGEIEASDSLWRAVKTIAVADAVMSLDNVVAIAAAAKGHPELFIFGLLLTIPLIIFGAQLIMGIIERYPAIVWAGAALLGWIAGEMIVGDKVLLDWLITAAPQMVVSVPIEENPVGMSPGPLLHYTAAAIGAAVVLVWGWALRRRAGETAH